MPNKMTTMAPHTPKKKKNHEVCFVLANYFLTWHPPWNVVDIPSNTAFLVMGETFHLQVLEPHLA